MCIRDSSRACVQKPKYVLVDSGAPDGSVSEAECLAIEGGAAWDRGAGMIKGCTKDNSGNIHFNTNTAANNNVPCGNNGVCIQKNIAISVATLAEAVELCEASSKCEGITKYKEFSNDVTIEDDLLLSGLVFDGNLHIKAGDDFKLYVYTPRTNSQSHRTDPYTYEHIQDASGGSLITSSGSVISFFDQNIDSSQSIGYDTSDITALGICKEDGYQFSQLTLHSPFISTLLCTNTIKYVGHDIKTDCFTGHEYKSAILQVSNGAAATVGSPEYLTYGECSQYIPDGVYNGFTTQTTTGRPPGCWFYAGTNVVYWNYQSDSTTTCDQGSCIKKISGCFPCGVGTKIGAPSDVYVETSSDKYPDGSITSITQCQVAAQQLGIAAWGGMSSWTSWPSGCITNAVFTAVWLNTHENSHACGASGLNCINTIKHSGCVNCPAGYSSYVFQSECYACPSGTFSTSGSTCENCAAGKYAAVTSGASSCADCEAGTLSLIHI